MHKLDYLIQKKLNPTDDLRDLLKQLEDSQPQIKHMNPTRALITLRNLDQIALLFDRLETTDADLTPEKARFKAIQSHLKRHVGRFLKALGGPAALSEYRPKPAPPRDRWWWYMHEMVAAEQQRFLRKMIMVGVAVIALIVGLFVAFNTILAPSPEALARVEAENSSLSAFDRGEYDEALAAVEESLKVVPGDPGLLILKGIFLEVTGEEAEALRTFDQSQQNLNDPGNFHIARGQLYFRIGELEKAEADARTAIEIDDTAPRAWFLLGQTLEFQGKKFRAIPAYQQAGELALNSGDDQIIVLARLALGRISGAVP